MQRWEREKKERNSSPSPYPLLPPLTPPDSPRPSLETRPKQDDDLCIDRLNKNRQTVKPRAMWTCTAHTHSKCVSAYFFARRSKTQTYCKYRCQVLRTANLLYSWSWLQLQGCVICPSQSGKINPSALPDNRPEDSGISTTVWWFC